MPENSFLADMNISPQTVEWLRGEGWDIVRVSYILPAKAPDIDVLGYARRDERVLVTQDLDFSTLLAVSGQDRPSLITLRLSVSDPQTVTQRLLDALPKIEQALKDGCAVIIEDAAIRVRRLPIQ
ncbi:MAG: DUF5615 family PIN-like protein [Planctomycetota bacterium]